MPLAYLSVAATGAAILQTAAVGPILGWTALLFDLGAVILIARFPRPLWSLFDIPGLLYLVTGAMGVELLLR